MEPIFVQKLAMATTSLLTDEPEGTFLAKVSAFGNKDSQGDVTEFGAFGKSLAARYKSGGFLPAVWSHQFHNPDMFLGKYFDWDESAESGLILKGRLNLKWAMAEKVLDLYKEDLVNEFSWSGRVEAYDRIEKGDPLFDADKEWMNGARIKEVDLWEAGPTFRGANPQTELLSVKQISGMSFTAKEGRVLRSEYVDVLKSARDMLEGVITSVEKNADTSTDEQKSGDSSLEGNPAVAGDQVRKAVLDPRIRARLALPID